MNVRTRDTRSSPLRVLIVEDEAVIALVLETMVEDAGHSVCGTAADADEAVALAECRQPDVVLMDIRLARGTDGVEAAFEIRTRFDIPCIFLSGNLDTLTRERAAMAQPVAMIRKPYQLAEIQQALERARPSRAR